MTHSFLPNFSRLVSGGAEEAGMNGGALTPKRAKARFARLSRGVAPQSHCPYRSSIFALKKVLVVEPLTFG